MVAPVRLTLRRCDYQERARLAGEVTRLVQMSAKSTADQDREISGLKDEMETQQRKLAEATKEVTELKNQLQATRAELESTQDDAGSRILSLQEKLEHEVRSKAKQITELVRVLWTAAVHGSRAPQQGKGGPAQLASLPPVTSGAQEALHRTELDNERREHAETKEDNSKKALALTALKDQLILKEREVTEARKRTENNDELLKKTMQVLRKEQDAVREKVRGAVLVCGCRRPTPLLLCSLPSSLLDRWCACCCPAVVLQLHEVSRERDALAEQVKAKEERIRGMENTISIAQEEVGDVKQVGVQPRARGNRMQ